MTVIGFLGTTLDQGTRGPSRWEHWRPTVSLCQHEDLLVDRLVLLKEAMWKGNFRGFGVSVRRMATLCEGGRMGVKDVDEEIARLHLQWRPADSAGLDGRRAKAIPAEAMHPIDRRQSRILLANRGSQQATDGGFHVQAACNQRTHA